MSDKFQGGVLAGSVDVSLPVLLLTVADSFGKTGSVAADMTLSYWRQGGVRVAVSGSNLAAVNSAHSDGGIKEVDAANMPGNYRVDWPDAAFAAGADWVNFTVLATGTVGWTQSLALTSNVVQSGDSFARLPAALVGGRMDSSVGAMAANVMTAAAAAADLTTELQSGLSTAAALAALNNLSAAQVNAEVVDALATDTYAEPGQGAPAATLSLAAKINYLFKAWRNKKTQTATTHNLFNDDAVTVDQKSTVSDDGTTATRGEVASGP